MCGCESWTIKKAAHRRIDAFELWCWRSLVRVPWTARRSIQSILKEISPGCSLEGLMLKLQYFDHLMRRPDSVEKTLMLGKTEGRMRRRWPRMRWLDSITNSIEMSLGKLQEMVKGSLACCNPWGCKELDITEQLNNNNIKNKKSRLSSRLTSCLEWQSWEREQVWENSSAEVSVYVHVVQKRNSSLLELYLLQSKILVCFCKRRYW